MQDFHTTVLFDISRTADKEIRYRRRERGWRGEREGGREGREGWRRWWRGGGVLKLQKDTYTGEITGEFSRGK